MISERSFASGFSSFWRGALPNLESVARALNSGWTRVDKPVASLNQPNRRDVISETGFKLFGASLGQKVSSDSVLVAFADAVESLKLSPAGGERSIGPLTQSEVDEVTVVAIRLRSFCAENLDRSSLIFEPRFPGHGIIGECKGDICDDNNLVEIKYVDRQFRSIDYRQCLVYAALRYFSKNSTFSNMILFNPYLGTLTKVTVEELVQGASGNAFVDFAADLSYLLTSGELSR